MMIDISILMDDGKVFAFQDIVGLTLQHDFKGGASIRFFKWKETKDCRNLVESAWSIGEDSDVESIVIKKGVR